MGGGVVKFESARDGMYNAVFAATFFLIAVAGFLVAFDSGSVGEKIILGVVLGLLSALMLSLCFRTFYVVENDRLIIWYGPFRTTLSRDRITAIRPHRSIYSAPALSRDRLQIRYDSYGDVQVSPRDKEGFLAAMGSLDQG